MSKLDGYVAQIRQDRSSSGLKRKITVDVDAEIASHVREVARELRLNVTKLHEAVYEAGYEHLVRQIPVGDGPDGENLPHAHGIDH